MVIADSNLEEFVVVLLLHASEENRTPPKPFFSEKVRNLQSIALYQTTQGNKYYNGQV